MSDRIIVIQGTRQDILTNTSIVRVLDAYLSTIGLKAPDLSLEELKLQLQPIEKEGKPWESSKFPFRHMKK